MILPFNAAEGASLFLINVSGGVQLYARKRGLVMNLSFFHFLFLYATGLTLCLCVKDVIIIFLNNCSSVALKQVPEWLFPF